MCVGNIYLFRVVVIHSDTRKLRSNTARLLEKFPATLVRTLFELVDECDLLDGGGTGQDGYVGEEARVQRVPGRGEKDHQQAGGHTQSGPVCHDRLDGAAGRRYSINFLSTRSTPVFFVCFVLQSIWWRYGDHVF